MRARQSPAKGSGFAIKLGVRPKPTSPRPTTPRLNGLQQAIDADRRPRWTFVQRGYWVHGVGDLRSSAGGGRLHARRPRRMGLSGRRARPVNNRPVR
jgi:hypothetical protein